MKDYAFRRKLIIILGVSIFVPTLIICVLIGCNAVNSQRREWKATLEEIERDNKNVIRETYNSYNMLAQSLSNYKTLNMLLSESDEIPIGTKLDYSYETQNVIGSIMASRQNAQLTIYTENSHVPDMKYITKMDDKMRSRYESLSEKSDVTLQFGIKDEGAYLYVLKKYKVIAGAEIGYNIIEIQIPVSDVLPDYDNEEEAIYIVFEDTEQDCSIPLSSERETMELYDAYKVGEKRLTLECSRYKSDYFDGIFYVLMDRQSYLAVIGKSIVSIAAVFLAFAVCILWVVQYTTEHLTKRLVDIVSAIRYDSIETLLSVDTPCDEFDIIEKKIVSMAQDLKKENEKVLKLELEALNHRLTPHFIYNNLSVLKWKCDDRDIDNIIDCMVAYYRNVFQKNSAFTIVEEEVANLVNYIRLLRFAYEDDFEYKANISPELMLYKIPSNIIQPLIENAFFHGINNIADRVGRIYLNIFVEKCVIIEVRDNGNKGEAQQKKKESSTTVIDKRIKLYYGSAYGLKRFSEDGYTVAQIQIPYEVETDEA